ncbi:MAG: GNAT family protein [Anaerolineae bacterium]|nr:MAG: GNAT family protein [Anaerolineae bacterium]
MLHLPITPFPELQTANLRLRQLKSSDADALFQIFSNDEVTKYYELETFSSIQDALALMASESARYEMGQAIRWGIAQFQNDIVIGTCGIKLDRDNHSADLGYDLAQPYWGKGLMFEALNIVIRFSFLSLKANRLQALVVPENHASIKLLERLNFQREGLLRQAAFFKGQHRDMVCYSLLSQEWSQA